MYPQERTQWRFSTEYEAHTRRKNTIEETYYSQYTVWGTHTTLEEEYPSQYTIWGTHTEKEYNGGRVPESVHSMRHTQEGTQWRKNTRVSTQYEVHTRRRNTMEKEYQIQYPVWGLQCYIIYTKGEREGTKSRKSTRVIVVVISGTCEGPSFV